MEKSISELVQGEIFISDYYKKDAIWKTIDVKYSHKNYYKVKAKSFVTAEEMDTIILNTLVNVINDKIELVQAFDAYIDEEMMTYVFLNVDTYETYYVPLACIPEGIEGFGEGNIEFILSIYNNQVIDYKNPIKLVQ